MTDISIVIPTYRRPELLARTLASCLAQQGLADAAVEIIVVDNDPALSARAAADAAAQSGGMPIRYIAEPRRGISYARNTGVANATGRYVAFIDDDEEAEPGWLAAFMATLRDSGAEMAVGPVRPRFPPAPAADSYARQAYTRDARVPSGTLLETWSGIGNALLDKERCFGGASADVEPFDPRLGLSGGEDALFLRQLLRRGGRIVWCAEAAVWESIAADKLAPTYLLRRAFRGAQTTTFVCTAVTPPERGRAALWMAVGCAQLVLYTPAALVLRALRHRCWLPVADRAVGGLGKVLWHPRLQPRLYQ
jgi:succinoglycan biosynthesis protein ExoM